MLGTPSLSYNLCRAIHILLIYNRDQNKCAFRLYLTTFSTHFSSNFLTSSLNISTSFQQSSGRLSFPLKHLMTSSLALLTDSSSFSTSTTFLLCSSLCFNAATSFCTLSRPNWRSVSPADFSVDESDVEGSSEDSFSVRSLKTWSSRACNRLSSSATRAWMWSSKVLARVESVCRQICQYSKLQFYGMGHA
jgi:hypothetical protein